MLINGEQNEFFQTTNSNELFPSKAIVRKITLSKSVRFYFEYVTDFSWANQGSLLAAKPRQVYCLCCTRVTLISMEERIFT